MTQATKRPSRKFVVYREATAVNVTELPGGKSGTQYAYGKWRWRLIATRNGQIVAASGENFDSKGNAIRAAKREASLFREGVAVVEVL